MSNLFQESSDGLLEEEKLTFGNGEVLFSEADQSNFIYLIKRGKVLLTKEEKGTLRKNGAFRSPGYYWAKFFNQ